MLTITLRSVLEAIQKLPFRAEILVVDNASGFDNEKLTEWFPTVQFTFLEKNVGFGAANNIGAEKAQGEVLLLLNPDTIVSPNALIQAAIKAKEEKIGGVGIRMIDACGNFLPESKRKMPTFTSSLLRILKLDKLMSRIVSNSSYYFEELLPTESGEIEILAGAFLAIDKQKFQRIGGFDTDFFMYGEDIDFSHRLTLAGYKNYYLGQEAIVHFKGESAANNTLKYLYHFFHSLLIFWKKHFPQSESPIFRLFALPMVWCAIGFSLLIRFLKTILLPLIDFMGIYGLLFSFTLFWSKNLKGNPNYYPPEFYGWILPVYITVIVFFHWLMGIYSQKSSAEKLIRSTFLSSIFIIFIYNFLPENYRYSRAILVMGSLASFIIPLFTHIVVFGKKTFFWNKSLDNSFLVRPENSRTKALEIIFAHFPYNISLTDLAEKNSNTLFDINEPFSELALHLALQKKSFSFFNSSLNCILLPQKSSEPSIAYGYWESLSSQFISIIAHKTAHIVFGWLLLGFIPLSKISFSNWLKICFGKKLFFAPSKINSLPIPSGIYDIEKLTINTDIKPWNFYYDYTFSNDVKLIFKSIF